MIKRIYFLNCINLLREKLKILKSLEKDFESNHKYKSKVHFSKTNLNCKIKDLAKRESNVSHLPAALSSMNTNLPSMAVHKICVNLPKLNIEKFN